MSERMKLPSPMQNESRVLPIPVASHQSGYGCNNVMETVKTTKLKERHCSSMFMPIRSEERDNSKVTSRSRLRPRMTGFLVANKSEWPPYESFQCVHPLAIKPSPDVSHPSKDSYERQERQSSSFLTPVLSQESNDNTKSRLDNSLSTCLSSPYIRIKHSCQHKIEQRFDLDCHEDIDCSNEFLLTLPTKSHEYYLHYPA